MRGLMMGRFQPFHLGHLELARQILDECDEVIIAVTSSQFNYLEKDPFTAGERIEMIYNSLKGSDLNLNRCIVLAIENQFNVATWPSYLKSMLPEFEKVYSGNDYVKMLLSDFGFTVVNPLFLEREKYTATKIRSLISSGEEWEHLVPSAVANFIKKINGKNRIQIISESDTRPTEH